MYRYMCILGADLRLPALPRAAQEAGGGGGGGAAGGGGRRRGAQGAAGGANSTYIIICHNVLLCDVISYKHTIIIYYNVL